MNYEGALSNSQHFCNWFGVSVNIDFVRKNTCQLIMKRPVRCVPHLSVVIHIGLYFENEA